MSEMSSENNGKFNKPWEKTFEMCEISDDVGVLPG